MGAFGGRIRPHVHKLIENIEDSPIEWGANSKYFYNPSRDIVFWVYCGRAQFMCIADVHSDTIGYKKFSMNSREKNAIYKAYKEWLCWRSEAYLNGYNEDIVL